LLVNGSTTIPQRVSKNKKGHNTYLQSRKRDWRTTKPGLSNYGVPGENKNGGQEKNRKALGKMTRKKWTTQLMVNVQCYERAVGGVPQKERVRGEGGGGWVFPKINLLSG